MREIWPRRWEYPYHFPAPHGATWNSLIAKQGHVIFVVSNSCFIPPECFFKQRHIYLEIVSSEFVPSSENRTMISGATVKIDALYRLSRTGLQFLKKRSNIVRVPRLVGILNRPHNLDRQLHNERIQVDIDQAEIDHGSIFGFLFCFTI